MQREENNIAYETNTPASHIKPGSVYDLASYIPVGNTEEKLATSKKQDATIFYVTSRRIKHEAAIIRSSLQKYHFLDTQNFFYGNKEKNIKTLLKGFCLMC